MNDPTRISLPSSPLDSPDSVSSFPSVSSSYFFSSEAQSPRTDPYHDNALIIPSLTLPPPLPRPSPYGKTLGQLRLLVFANSNLLTDTLLNDNEDIVEIGPWERIHPHASVLHASTDWIEHRDAHGLERFEPARNVEIVQLHSEEEDDVMCLTFCYCA